jgi:ribosomal protein S4
MRKPNRYCLKRIQPKLSWDPANIYNMIRWKPLDDRNLDIYQQQWKSKTLCRLYFNGDVRHKVFRRMFYNVGFRNIYQTIAHNERLLENALFRAMFASSVYSARYMIYRGYIHVNGEMVRQPTLALKDGDLISVKPVAIPMIEKEITTNPWARYWAFIPPYLEVNHPSLSFVFLRTPTYEEIPHPFPKSMIDFFGGFYQKS